jgi:hypothetical protein
MTKIEEQMILMNSAVKAKNYDSLLERLKDLMLSVIVTDDIDWNVGDEYLLVNVIEGTYWFCVDYHHGMYSSEYELLSIIEKIFKPGCQNESEDEFIKIFYQELEQLRKKV